MAITFPMTAYNNAFKAGFGRNGGEEAGVAFADCEAG